VHYAAGLIGSGRAAIDVIVLWRERRTLTSLALTAGYLPSRLEDEGICEIEKEMRALITRLPRHLAVRFSALGDQDHHGMERCLGNCSYDVVITPEPGLSYRRRRLAWPLRNRGEHLVFYSLRDEGIVDPSSLPGTA
jgi:hypothetical protein